MTLLIYERSAKPTDGAPSLLITLSRHLEEAFSDCFVLLATHQAPVDVSLGPDADWVTLPLQSGADSAAARMLRIYAELYRPQATVFLGDDSDAITGEQTECFGLRVVVGERSATGSDVVLSQDGYLTRLLPLLREKVAASVLIEPGQAERAVADALARRAESDRLELFATAGLTDEIAELLPKVRERFSGAVELQLGLRETLLSGGAKALKTLRLIASAKNRIELRLVSEVTPLQAQRALTRALAWAQQTKRRAP